MTKERQNHPLVQPVRVVPEEAILARLRDAENPGAIVKALVPHDFLTVFRAADDEQKSDLLTLADTEQVNLLLDLSCWKKDRPDVERIESTLKPLVMTGLGGATRALDALENDLITLFLRRNTVVHLLENRNDELQAAPTSEVMPFPDGFYFLEFPEPDAITDTQRALFHALSAKPFEHYQRELECIRHDLVPEMEERALKWQTARLADYGFAPRHEAISLLAARSAEEVRGLAASQSNLPLVNDGQMNLPILFRKNLAGTSFLDAVFTAMTRADDEQSQQRIGHVEVSLTATLGTYLTATATDIGTPDAVARGIQGARNLLSLGLQETAKNEVNAGVNLLLNLAPAYFVQVGLGMLYPLQKRAQKLFRDNTINPAGRPGQVFDPVHYLTLSSLCADIPKCFVPALDNESPLFDLTEPLPTEVAVIDGLENLKKTEAILMEAEQLPSLLLDMMATTHVPEETPASVLLMTALANESLGRTLRTTPLNGDEAMVFYTKVRDAGMDSFTSQALAMVSAPLRISPSGPFHTAGENDPMRRLILRLIQTGTARLLSDDPRRALSVLS